MTIDELHEGVLDSDPLRLFGAWLEEARAAGVVEPHALALATIDASGGPDVRFVLLRALDERGFVFYTNRESAKGRQLDADARAAFAVHWDRLGRQVRASGRVEPVERTESESYWSGRPRGHRLAAWASPQSEPIGSRAELEAAFAAVAARFPGEAIPLPPFWGGYRLVPETIEFWLSREDRLHDRIRYRRSGRGWRRERLAP